MTQIRRLRRGLMVQIAVTDLLKRQSIEQSYRLLSELADCLINAAYQMAYQQISKVFGSATDLEDQPMPMMILGMGKLGGRELNFSSDIDLIFSYAHGGQTSGGRKVIDHQLFFTKVAQKLIDYLHRNSADGFVFRVDMRLRPFGDSGPLVMSFAAMEDYYQQQGRDWERYAMLKCRMIIEPEHKDALELTQLLRPFVFRRYIDFSVIGSLRKMKLLIGQEARRKGEQVNIKLGSGGIREVEFIAQALQLIKGGQQKQLQVKPLLSALEQLALVGDLNVEQHRLLREGYLYLRRCEHYLQQFDDKQTQLLPHSTVDRQRLSHLLDCRDWPATVAQVLAVMAQIEQEFSAIIAPEGEQPSDQLSDYELYWHSLDFGQPSDDGQSDSLFHWLDEQTRLAFNQLLVQFKLDGQKRAVGGRGREVLDKLIPQLLGSLAGSKEGLETLKRVLNVIARISSRTAYLDLLDQNAGALNQLVKLCGKSLWVAEQLAIQPLLLDQLIDPALLYQPLALDAYLQALEQHMMRVPEDDMEQQLEALRHFKLSHQLHIAAADISQVLTLPQVSAHLTALADAIMVSVVNISWKQMVWRYGAPPGRTLHNKGFAVIAYGKMGGGELGYGSDLDVVFVHDCQGNQPTNGKKVIDSRQFYLKLCQRIVHIFTTRTLSGILYEVDNRLRPQGNSGLLACHIQTYQAYLAEEAWTWEHQALVRTRMVCGEPGLKAQFSRIRRQILTLPRERAQLKQDVVAMRHKMRDSLVKNVAGMFDLKQGIGGMADIEFISQYLVLAYSAQHPELTDRCSNSELFALFAQLHLLTEQQAEVLTAGYYQLRHCYHQRCLQHLDKLTATENVQQLSGQIVQIWQQLFD